MQKTRLEPAARILAVSPLDVFDSGAPKKLFRKLSVARAIWISRWRFFATRRMAR
jgi:hypothetical protein